jgi:transcriptional regulator of acetoin/glycerol metabolism
MGMLYEISIKEWQSLKNKLTEGDTIKLTDMDKLTDCEELMSLVSFAQKNKIIIEADSEPWLTAEVVEGLSKLNKVIFSNKIVAGMKKSGKKYGRPSKEKNVDKAISMYLTGEFTGEEISKICNISRSTLYRNLKKRGIEY